MAHSINKDLCIGCGVCEETCPLGAITADAEGKREINADDHRALISQFIENVGEA